MNRQTTQVYEYMQQRGRISQLKATYELGITRLGARIWDLKHLGIDVKDEMVYHITEDGERKKWKEYWLA